MSAQEGRTKKVARNTIFSLIYKLSDFVLAFALRTIFIHTLGRIYLGISGLFTNILTVLSLMDLGVGGAIVFSLYKPLAQKDNGKVAALMQLYKKVYTTIGILVCGIGFCITPFLKYIINLPTNIDNLYVIYWLSIANTAISYFLAYRRSLLIADQRSDLDYKNQLIFRITRFVVLSLTLLIFKNYILYLALDVINTLCSNIHITYLVKKNYSYIEKCSVNPLNAEEKRNIIKYMSSGIFSKFGQTVVNSTDNIIISAFISTALVGIYANYSMITGSLDVAIYILFSGLTASIGNYALQNSNTASEELFKKITFINYISTAIITVCLYSLVNPFVRLWAGEDYLLSNATVAVIVLNFYIATLQKSIECFMGARGELFYINRFRSLIEGIVNLTVSIFLVKYTSLGITGIFLGTTVCFLTGRVWMDAHTLYKHWFHISIVKYLTRYIARFGTTVVIAIGGRMITEYFFAQVGINIVTWILSGIVLVLLTGGCLWILYHSSNEYKFLINMVKQKLFKVKE